ncbi:MAG: box helicase [Bacillales bacterium]|nr:box helicase [Bacillales bacterium]
MKRKVNLQEFLTGRALLDTEIPVEKEVLEDSVQKGFVVKIEGLVDGRCMRCGNSDKHFLGEYPCFRCKTVCLYCRKCIEMGRISSCSKLYTWVGKPFTWPPSRCHWSGRLSEQQMDASKKIIEALKTGQDLLVWAVAGAGKTEMIFGGIEWALKHGKRIAVACPRTDVILELEPRLKAAFPETSIATLYGASEEKHVCAQLILSTTHQLFRFKNAFDLLVVDEVDAFPYSMDAELQLASKEAAKLDATTIYLTATPTREWQNDYFSGKRNGVHIPARFHRHPNPVPTMKWIGDWKKAISKKQVPASLHVWLSKQKNPFLLFFPHIELMNQALPLIQQITPNSLSVHAEDPDRKEKVQMLREGRIQGLLTTTILERGVTIKAVDVVVVGAEDKTFTEAALVQIAGRVGRSPDKPDGKVLFLHQGKTEEMIQAIKQIVTNNRIARERGLLDG